MIDVALGLDQLATIGPDGAWGVEVALTPGVNDITVRLGDDRSTAVTWTVTSVVTAVASTAPPTQEPTPSPTMAPTPAATPEPPEPTAAPTPTDASAFTPITLRGRGNKVARFRIPEEAVAIATISHRGRSNFVVWTVDAGGSTTDLLVNEIGNFKGTTLFDVSGHSVAFKVEADGNWTIVVKPLSAARQWRGQRPVTGVGADVVILLPPTSGLTVARIRHTGRSNFVVWTYGEFSSDLIVNEIGRYSGESLLEEGTTVFHIEADGRWSIALER